MPAPRAVLADINKLGLNPKKKHGFLKKSGHLANKEILISSKEEIITEKPGLVFLTQQEEKEKVQQPVKVVEEVNQHINTQQEVEFLEQVQEEEQVQQDVIEQDQQVQEEEQVQEENATLDVEKQEESLTAKPVQSFGMTEKQKKKQKSYSK